MESNISTLNTFLDKNIFVKLPLLYSIKLSIFNEFIIIFFISLMLIILL